MRQHARVLRFLVVALAVGGAGLAAPILAHGLLYVRDKDHLYCLDLIPDRPR